jgi:shikimate dehydrogenase
MAQRFAPLVRVAESADEAVRDASLVVNATSVGLHDDQLPVAITALQRQAAVLDLVYRAGETAFVRAARDTGHRAADGLAMLMEQGALAFERWFHVAPDRAAMWRAVEPIG